jgi:transcriptional regulator with XRE-family HTH domain
MSAATSHLDEVANGEGHAPDRRTRRRILSRPWVGGFDALERIAIQTQVVASLKDIGARVRQLRLAEGIGQEELAAAIGVSRSTIAGIETGGDRGGIETMIALADHYKVPMDHLLDRKLPPGSPPVGELVHRPDQVAVLRLWNSLPFDIQTRLIEALQTITLGEIGNGGRRNRRRNVTKK